MSIADKLTYLNTTKQLLKTEINKINNVLTDNSTFRSYPQELFNGYLDILNNGTDTLWSNLEKVSASGETPVLENVETAPMKMVLNGNTSQDGEPTPDTPVEVKVVKGENVVSVSGKNKFNIDDILVGTKINDRTFTATHVSGKLIDINFDANTKYNIGFKITQSTNSNGVFVRIMYTDGTNSVLNSIATTATEKSILTQKAISEILLQYSTYNTITTFEDFYIYEETEDLDFVPYSKTDYPINLGDIELCKINTYKDYFHKDSGKWYVHKEIGKKIVDENSSVAVYSVPRFRIYGVNFVSPSATEKADILCDKLRAVTKNALASANNVISGSDGGKTGEMLVRINAEINTLDLFKQFLAENNLTIYYVLATPTEEEITNTTLIEQLEAIYKAKSVKDKTYVTQTNDELPFILDVEAIKEYEVN